MRALVLAGGDLVVTPRIRNLCQGADVVVAADSGLRHARALGLEPVAVVGDFDSVSAEDLAAFPRLPRLRHPARKNLLDLELAIDLALERGARQVTILGAFGSRLDQSLAALLVAARLRCGGTPITLHDGQRDAYPLSPGDALSLRLPAGTLFSLLALEDAVCSVSGAEYPLAGASLPFGSGLGISNLARGGPHVEVHSGLVAVIVEWTESQEAGGR